MHCSNLGASALHKAMQDYAQKKGIEIKGLKVEEEEEHEDGEKTC
jgi:DNA mismatch repair protein MutH